MVMTAAEGRIEEIRDLYEALREADAPCFKLDARIHAVLCTGDDACDAVFEKCFPHNGRAEYRPPEYTRSIDAVFSVYEERFTTSAAMGALMSSGYATHPQQGYGRHYVCNEMCCRLMRRLYYTLNGKAL